MIATSRPTAQRERAASSSPAPSPGPRPAKSPRAAPESAVIVEAAPSPGRRPSSPSSLRAWSPDQVGPEGATRSARRSSRASRSRSTPSGLRVRRRRLAAGASPRASIRRSSSSARASSKSSAAWRTRPAVEANSHSRRLPPSGPRSRPAGGPGSRPISSRPAAAPPPGAGPARRPRRESPTGGTAPRPRPLLRPLGPRGELVRLGPRPARSGGRSGGSRRPGLRWRAWDRLRCDFGDGDTIQEDRSRGTSLITLSPRIGPARAVRGGPSAVFRRRAGRRKW